MNEPTIEQIRYCTITINDYDIEVRKLNLNQTIAEYDLLKSVLNKVYNLEEESYIEYYEELKHLTDLLEVIKRETFNQLYVYYKSSRRNND